MTQIADVIRRLISLVDEETAALRRGDHQQIEDFRNRKGHGLLELSRASGGIRHSAMSDPRISPMLAELRKKLELNQAVLKVHLDAMTDVAAILSNVIRESEWDGTYSQGSGNYGYCP